MNFRDAWKLIVNDGLTCRPVGSQLGFYLDGSILNDINSGQVNCMPVHLMLGPWEIAPEKPDREKSPDEKIAERDKLLSQIYSTLVYHGEHQNLSLAIAAMIGINEGDAG